MPAKLITVTREDLAITRRRCGRGFTYLDADGEPVRDQAVRSRIKALAIPPAWTDVAIAVHERAHIQACGEDDAGRVQYVYHAEWEVRRDGRKAERLARLSLALARVRRRVARDLGAPAGSPELALAVAAALIDRTAMRLGSERYLETAGTRGAATLLKSDVAVSGSRVRLRFAAKGGQEVDYTLTHRTLAQAITRLKTLPGKRLLVCRNGRCKPVTTEAINRYLREAAGAEISAKDFRTLHASAMAGEELARIEPGASEARRRRQIAEVSKKVAEFLRNTPAISRKSYIAPGLIELFESGRLGRLWNRPDGRRTLMRRREARLGRVLEALE